jgi:glycosyltransferase involved in cell wall biosynthesis
MTHTPPFRERLVIVSNVVHYRAGGKFWAYAPYAREIEMWADLFDSVLIAAPCRDEKPLGDCVPIARGNVEMAPQREAGGDTLVAKLKLAGALPKIVWELASAMRQGDAVQIRCPSNLGLIGSVIAPLFAKHRVAKYAGQWNNTPQDGLGLRFQRFMLRSRWWGSPVTVYGDWPGQPAHIIPFFNSALTDSQLHQAGASAKNRSVDQLRHVVFTGRLTRAKNVDVLLKALGRISAEGISFTASILGDGPELSPLKKLTAELKLESRVEFLGGVEFDKVVEVLGRSGVLVLASQTEGWPKALVEGMAFGLVAIGSDVGLVANILGENRGFVVPPGDVDALANVLREVLSQPEKYADMRSHAATWAGRYSIEYLRDSLQALLARSWRIQMNQEEHSVESNSFVAKEQHLGNESRVEQFN